VTEIETSPSGSEAPADLAPIASEVLIAPAVDPPHPTEGEGQRETDGQPETESRPVTDGQRETEGQRETDAAVDDPATSTSTAPAPVARVGAWLAQIHPLRRIKRTTPDGLGMMAALVLVLIPAALALVPMLTYGGSYSNWGDGAATELSVQRATHFAQVLGPYDRFGWQHPGPLAFYVLAIPYSLLGGRSIAIPIGSVLVNLLAVVFVVTLVCRRAGWAAGLGVAGLACTYESFLGASNLTNVWNPVLITLPAFLALVLCADVAAGGTWTMPAAVVAVSFVVQTHVGTAAPMLTVLLLALVTRAISWLRSGGARRRVTRAAIVTAVTIAVGLIVWAPPLHQQFTARHPNMTAILNFFQKPNRAHSWRDSYAALANGLMVGRAVTRNAFDAGATKGNVVYLIPLVLAALIVAGWCWRRHQWFGMALSLGSLIAGLVFLITLLHVVGPINGYLLWWSSALTASLGVAAIACVLAPGDTQRTMAQWTPEGRVVGRVVLAAFAVFACWRLSGQASHFRVGDGYGDVTIAARTVEHLLPSRKAPVLVCITSSAPAPTSDGVIADLRRDGFDPRVEPRWDFVVGDDLKPRGNEKVVLFIDSIVGIPPQLTVGPVIALQAGGVGLRLYVSPAPLTAAAVCPTTV